MDTLPLEMRELYQKRLWHELTERMILLDSAEISAVWSGISLFWDKLNQTKLVLLAMKATEVQDSSTAFVFLDNLSIVESQACLLLKIAKSAQYLQIGSTQEAQALLEEAQKQVDRESSLEGVIYSHLYKNLAHLYKLKNNPELFYKYSLQYLAYTPQSEVKDPEDLAYRLAISVLLAENIYNLGELLHLPVLKSLEHSKNAWLYQLIHDCNEGKVREIEKKFEGFPAELKSANFLRKCRILAMLEFVFVGNQRVLGFRKLAEVMNVQEPEIEVLVMKAMALGLIKGEIDEVDRVVSISWLQPRVLDKIRISHLNSRLTDWKSTINQVLLHLEVQSKELLE